MEYKDIYIYFFAMIFLIIGGIVWGIIGIFDINIITKYIPVNYQKIIYILVGMSALYLSMERNTYLPFLNDTVLPCYNLEDKVPDRANEKITVDVPKNVKVVYWCADSKNTEEILNYQEAYADYSNSGIATSNDEGKATLYFRTPQEYSVKKYGILTKILKPHVHYRFCRANGMMSEVKTVFL